VCGGSFSIQWTGIAAGFSRSFATKWRAEPRAQGGERSPRGNTKNSGRAVDRD
jgi:hypothetical protein